MKDIKQWVLITGASSGLGTVFAREYAKKGYNLVLTARRIDALKKLADELTTAHRVECHVEPADLSTVGAAAKLKKALDAIPINVDVLINNAGMGIHGDFLESSHEKLACMLQLDIVALTELTHVFGQSMVGRGAGKILLVSSVLGYQAAPGYAAYAASKAYVLSLGESLHEELKTSGVTLTVLSPGLTNTDFISVAEQPVSPAMKRVMMEPVPVVKAGIRALESGRASVVPGWFNLISSQSNRFTPRSLQRRFMARALRGH
ncbi:short-chain dehydrogenase [Marinobacter sp. EhC06]|jgi:short-subunit dehydrogenase|uniref:SDR family NAD(P)-dependent oxidoreductase n=1 Tax=Marinobacter TaxID=2742 RepID=UPI0007D91F26|nr:MULTISPECIES: SDR family oxidoreductase [unclassified Marinobacter]OAN95282.1 short-chain dehydrogenase [Marinobacter sp. EhC06]OAN96007.1 short-chain dehydrogenase [Marinobacter sp. EhN04]